MSNTTEIAEEDDYDPVWVLIGALYRMTMLVTTPVRQFVTCLLSGFFVVGILLIIPALVQTAAAYVWAAQIRKESSIPISLLSHKEHSGHSGHNRIHQGRPSQAKLASVSKLLSQQDRTLFLYRLLACSSSLLVLIFSTLPQLVMAVSKPPRETETLDKLWGWCQAFIYADYSTRCFATYLIVVPFGLMFWNYLFSEIVPQRRLLTNNVFHAILVAAIPTALFAFLVPIGFVARQFTKMVLDDGSAVLCNPTPDGLVTAMYYDFIVTRIIPVILILSIGAGFLRWLPRKDYGVFYEPGIFLLFVLPHMWCELVIHICHRAHWLDRLVEPNFSNFMLIAYSCYHMSFSSTFVLATLRSVVSEIREEMRRRQLLIYGDPVTDGTSTDADDSMGNKRHTNLVHGLQKQFSVAFRWKPDFTEEETRTFINPPDLLDSDEEGDWSEEEGDHEGNGVHSSSNPTKNTGAARTSGQQTRQQADDAVLHYAILQHSAKMKRPDPPEPVSPNRSRGNRARFSNRPPR